MPSRLTHRPRRPAPPGNTAAQPLVLNIIITPLSLQIASVPVCRLSQSANHVSGRGCSLQIETHNLQTETVCRWEKGGGQWCVSQSADWKHSLQIEIFFVAVCKLFFLETQFAGWVSVCRLSQSADRNQHILEADKTAPTARVCILNSNDSAWKRRELGSSFRRMADGRLLVACSGCQLEAT